MELCTHIPLRCSHNTHWDMQNTRNETIRFGTIPKVASSQFRWSFRHGGFKNSPRKQTPIKFVSLIRNPFFRLFSSYSTISSRATKFGADKFNFLSYKQNSTQRFYSFMHQLKNINFTSLPCNEYELWAHALPQYNFIDHNLNIPYKIFDLENLNTSVKEMIEWAEFDPNLYNIIVKHECAEHTKKCPENSYAYNKDEGHIGKFLFDTQIVKDFVNEFYRRDYICINQPSWKM